MHKPIWTNALTVNNSQIAEHHRRLFDILSRTYYCSLDCAQESDLRGLLNELDEYTKYHFSAEEKLMESHGFNEQHLHEHTVEHRLFILQIERFRQDLIKGTLLLRAEMVKFLMDWLTKHILYTDRELFRHLAENDLQNRAHIRP